MFNNNNKSADETEVENFILLYILNLWKEISHYNIDEENPDVLKERIFHTIDDLYHHKYDESYNYDKNAEMLLEQASQNVNMTLISNHFSSYEYLSASSVCINLEKEKNISIESLIQIKDWIDYSIEFMKHVEFVANIIRNYEKEKKLRDGAIGS